MDPARARRLLVLEPGASEKEIHGAFRRQVVRWHPDVNPKPLGTERFLLLTQARDTLLDELRAPRPAPEPQVHDPWTEVPTVRQQADPAHDQAPPGHEPSDDPWDQVPTARERIEPEGGALEPTERFEDPVTGEDDPPVGVLPDEQADTGGALTSGERVTVLTLGAFLVLSCIWVFILPLLYINGVEVASADGTWLSRRHYSQPSERGMHILLAVPPLLSLAFLLFSARRQAHLFTLREFLALVAGCLAVLAGIALVTLMTLWPGWAPDLALLWLTGIALGAPAVPLLFMVEITPQEFYSLEESVSPEEKSCLRTLGLVCTGLLVWPTWGGTHRLLEPGTSLNGLWLSGIVGLLLLFVLWVLHFASLYESGDKGEPKIDGLIMVTMVFALPLYGILTVLVFFGDTAVIVMTVLRWLIVLIVPTLSGLLFLRFGVSAPTKPGDPE